MKYPTAIATALWAASLYAGGAALYRHQWTAGPSANPPGSTVLAKTKNRGWMFVFLHPECPCSQATLAELAKIAAAKPDAFLITLYYFQPRGRSEKWCQGKLWDLGGVIPGAIRRVDPEGKMARNFGARVSGQVLVYQASDSKLVFSGGVTYGRGHEGANPGADAILAFARTGVVSLKSTPVYGCVIL